MDDKMIVDLSSGGSKASNEENAHGVSELSPNQITKPSSSRAATKENTEARNSGTLPSAVSMPGSYFPDLYISCPSSGIFQQPFTKAQQLQLRAQILVYGALKQGEVPDEMWMTIAFGRSDGGSNVWEPIWRTRVEKTRGQESLSHETPTLPSLGDRISVQLDQQNSDQSKKVPLHLGEATSGNMPSPIENPMIPLLSPLWNVSTPDHHQELSPLHMLKAPAARGSVRHSTSYVSQSPFLGPRITSLTPQTSGFDATAHVSSGIKHASPSTLNTTRKLMPGKEKPGLELKLATPSTVAHSSGFNIRTETPFSEGQKPRKKKTSLITEALGHISSRRKFQTEQEFAPVGTSHSTQACNLSQSSVGDMEIAASPMSSNWHQKMGVEDTFSCVEGAMKQAEEAAASVATAISQSRSLLALLNMQNNSQVAQDIEAKIASSAMVRKAALCVAKAAKGAAKVATKIAWRAKLMAEEALVSQPDTDNLVTAAPSVIIAAQEAAKKRVETASATSIDAENLNAIIKSVELAGESVSQAEKAITLGDSVPVEARPQKCFEGVISSDYSIQQLWADLIERGAPKDMSAACGLPCLSKGILIESVGGKLDSFTRPEKETRGQRSSIAFDMAKTIGVVPETEMGLQYGASTDKLVSHSATDNLVAVTPVIIAAKRATENRVEAASAASKHAENLDAIVKDAEFAAESVSHALGDSLPVEASPQESFKILTLSNHSVQHSQVDLIEKEIPEWGMSAEYGLPRPLKEVLIESVGGKLDSSARHGEKTRGQEISIASDMCKTIGVVTESEIGLRYCSSTDQDFGTSMKDNIKEGSLVEVHKERGKRGWFSANVLSLEDGKAFVCYTHLQSNEGEEKLKEWVAIENEVNGAPKIRVAHPVTSTPPDGTRKRLRMAMEDFVWSIGDRVDVWAPDCFCWREGVVTEKDKKNDRTVNVHFPVEGETLAVKTWHLRPTLIWNEEKWVQWFSLARENNPSSQGDNPPLKKLKLGVPETECKQDESACEKIEAVKLKKSSESRLPLLSTHKKLFKNGKSVSGKDFTDLRKTAWTNCQEEGSKVLSGVPNPRKMKNLTELTNRNTETNKSGDSIKFKKYLAPQKFGSRRSKTVSKDSMKAKQETSYKARADKVARPRPQPLRNKDLTLGSSTGGKRSKVVTRDKPDNGNTRQSVSEVVEQRRSNRKAQPTSRLLEGLETSTTTSKQVVSHDKSRPSQHKASPKFPDSGFVTK